MIGFFNDGSDYRPPFKGKVAEWLRGVVEQEDRLARETDGRGLRLGAVNFVFCSPEKQLETNRNFLGHDWPTDVITFDYSTVLRSPQSPRLVAADVFIDPAEVARNAKIFFAAPQKEMRRVMVHGVLHLCGYGDKTPKEQRTMRAKEDFYLSRFYGVDRYL